MSHYRFTVIKWTELSRWNLKFYFEVLMENLLELLNFIGHYETSCSACVTSFIKRMFISALKCFLQVENAESYCSIMKNAGIGIDFEVLIYILFIRILIL